VLSGGLLLAVAALTVLGSPGVARGDAVTERNIRASDAIDMVSSRFPGTPAQTRHFAGFSHALEDVIDARGWGGIHVRTADTQGAVSGRKIARWERKRYFRPVG
jgi:hypothetical protein